MQEYNVILTLEAVNDIAEIAGNIELNFGKERADFFQKNIQKEIFDLKFWGSIFPKISIHYKGYKIYKKLFLPSIIFYVIDESTHEIHVLRVLRQERDWQNILKSQKYTYPQ